MQWPRPPSWYLGGTVKEEVASNPLRVETLSRTCRVGAKQLHQREQERYKELTLQIVV